MQRRGDKPACRRHVSGRRPLIADLLAVSRRARAQSRSDGARNRNRNQPR